jgi:hypothetical protein
MVVTHVGSFPPDPEADLKNFQRKQAEYKAAYHHAKEPFALYEALLNADAYLQFPADLNWLMVAIGEFITKGRTDKMAERLRERMRHVQRYRCVRDLLQKGHAWGRALDLAVTKLEATDAAGMLSTIKKSYMKVKHDLEQAGRDSEYFFLVTRSDPTRVPVAVSQAPSGEVIVNGVVQQSPEEVEKGPIVGPTVGSRMLSRISLNHCEDSPELHDERETT